MDKKHTERKTDLIWMKEEKEKYRIKINIDNKAAEKTDRQTDKKNLKKTIK